MKQVLLLLILASVNPIKSYTQINIGTKAPELNIEEVYYQKTKKNGALPTLKGNIIILDFWAVWCSPCVAAFPENNRLSNKYKDKGVTFIAVTDDPVKNLENFLDKIEVDFYIARDDDGQSFKDYKIKHRPQMYIINRNGNIVYQGHSVTEEMIDQVIATDSLSFPKKNGSQNLHENNQKIIVNGGFSPGEDPLYNGVRIMLGNSTDTRPHLINHFIIRPSLSDSWGGNGIRAYKNYVGVTYYGGKLENIFQFLHGLPSPVWIRNNTSDSTLYDLVYWKKADNINEAMAEIEQSFQESLSIKLDSVKSEEQINLMSIDEENEFIKHKSKIKMGAQNVYTPVSMFVSLLETKSQQLYMADESLQNMFIHNTELRSEKLYNATTQEILTFLREKGIIIQDIKMAVTLYEINDN